jgi:nicotinamidase-related amidase
MLPEPYDLVRPAPPAPPLDPRQTALLIIDLQYVCASRELGLGRAAREQGNAEALRYRFERIDEIVPRVRRLAAGCREAGVQVIYVRVATGLPDGRDGSPSLRGLWCAEGSREADILDEVAPQEGDLILSKKSISAFTTTSIDQTLRHLGIRTLITTGVVTNGCVELTIRDAADHGYHGIVVDDCCGANSEALHLDALERLNRGLLRVSQSEDILRDLVRVPAGSMAV